MFCQTLEDIANYWENMFLYMYNCLICKWYLIMSLELDKIGSVFPMKTSVQPKVETPVVVETSPKNGKKWIVATTAITSVALATLMIYKKLAKGAQQVSGLLSDSVRRLVDDGRLSLKEAEMFESIKGLEGDEFISTVYQKLAGVLGLKHVPELKIVHDASSMNTGHYGKNITINPDAYPAVPDRKMLILGDIRHELEHFRQDLVSLAYGGEDEYTRAFLGMKANQYAMRHFGSKNFLQEDCMKYGIDYESLPRRIVDGREEIGISPELVDALLRNEKPFAVFQRYNGPDVVGMFDEAQLTRGEEYLDGMTRYLSLDWLPELELRYLQNPSSLSAEELERVDTALLQMFRTNYFDNVLEVSAEEASRNIRDKYRIFLDAETI